jgi:hypothetical protein
MVVRDDLTGRYATAVYAAVTCIKDVSHSENQLAQKLIPFCQLHFR